MSEDKQPKDTEKKIKWTKKTTIKAIVTTVIIALLIMSIILYVKKNNANAQLDQFASSIENDNSKRLADVLSTNNRKMSNAEAKHLINYFKQADNAKRLNETLKEVKSNIKSDNATADLGTFKDANNKPILDFSKNGKKMFFIDKISIEPHYRTVYIEEADNSATYIIDKEHQVSVDKNKLNELGSFVVGSYDIAAKKEFKEGAVKGKVNGTIHINTDNLNKSNKVVAKQSFNQTKIEIALHNASKLDKEKLIINGKTTELDTNKTYGYYPNNNRFTVQATGQTKGHVFKTNKVDVLQGTTYNSTQIVNLKFDDKDIEKTIEKDNKDKEKISRFIKEYMDSLNKAYKKTDYDEIKDYIKTGSQADKFMKPKFKDKQNIKYTNTKVKSVKKDGDTYTVVITKQYKDNTVGTQYKVQDNKIIDIQDV